MSDAILIDTNVLVRYLTHDDPRKAARCRDLFQRAAKGEVELILTDLCLAELAWTLASHYQLERQQIADYLEATVTAPGLVCSDLNLWLHTLRLYSTTTVSFIDAYHAALAHRDGQKVCSYDRDFDRFPDIQRIEP